MPNIEIQLVCPIHTLTILQGKLWNQKIAVVNSKMVLLVFLMLLSTGIQKEKFPLGSVQILMRIFKMFIKNVITQELVVINKKLIRIKIYIIKTSIFRLYFSLTLFIIDMGLIIHLLFAFSHFSLLASLLHIFHFLLVNNIG